METIKFSDIINTTPHDVHVHTPSGAVYTIASDPLRQLRMRQSAPSDAPIELLLAPDVHLSVTAAPQFTSIDGPMEELLESVILVSMPVGEFIRAHRADGFEATVVLGPDTGPAGAVRDGAGRIVGTRGIVMY